MKFADGEYPRSYYGLLAFLSQGPQSGYDIKKLLEDPEIFYWRESHGNVYPMLRKLEENGLLDKRDSYIKSKKRVIYQLNDAGRAVLLKWLVKPAELCRFRVEILMKIRFGKSAGVSNMIDQVKRYLSLSEKELSETDRIISDITSEEKSLENDFRLIASNYFKYLKESNKKWCLNTLEILQKWL